MGWFDALAVISGAAMTTGGAALGKLASAKQYRCGGWLSYLLFISNLKLPHTCSLYHNILGRPADNTRQVPGCKLNTL